MARKKSTKVTNDTVLSAALKSKVRKVVVVGEDSHGNLYVAAAGRISNADEISQTIAQLADAGAFLRRIRAKIVRAEKATKAKRRK